MSSQFFSGELSATNLLDEFPVSFQAGDEIAAVTYGAVNRPTIRVEDSDGNFVTGASGFSGGFDAQTYLSPYVIQSTGTYMVQVIPAFATPNSYSSYELRVDTMRGGQLEHDPSGTNNTTNSNDVLEFERTGDILTRAVGGALDYRDIGDVDYFQIGFLPAGSIVTIDASNLPSGTSLRPTVELVDNDSTVIEDSNFDPSIAQAIVPRDGDYKVRITNSEIIQDNKSYIFNPSLLSWDQAQAAAVAIGGNLVSIESASLNRRIATELPIATAWIGLNDVGTPNNYQWSDGTDSDYRRWLSANPTGQDYAAIHNTYTCACSNAGRWITPDQDSLLPSVIEIDSDGSGLTGTGFRATYAANVTIDTSVLPKITGSTPSELTDGSAIATVTNSVGTIDLFVNKDLDPASVDDSNFTLMSAGVDGVLGNADDVNFPISASYEAPHRTIRNLRLEILNGLLPNGLYQLNIGGTVTDLAGTALDSDDNGVAGGVGVLTFIVDAFGSQDVIEGVANGTPESADTLLISDDPSGTPWKRSQTGRGIIDNDSDVDYWKFDLQQGDVINVQALATKFSGIVKFDLFYQRDNGFLTRLNFNINDLLDYEAQQDATYFIKVFGQADSDYLLDIRINNEIQLEKISTVNTLSTFPGETLGSRIAHFGGTLLSEGDVDFFSIGALEAGTLVHIETNEFPQWSDVRLEIEFRSDDIVDLNPSPDAFSGFLTEDDSPRIYVNRASGESGVTNYSDWGIDHQYSLSVTTIEYNPPSVMEFSNQTQTEVDTELIIDHFVDKLDIEFSEQIEESTLSADDFDLRSPGNDAIFDTFDDIVYSVGWDLGIRLDEGQISVLDGPLDNGRYRFSLRDTVTDRHGNPLDGDGDGLAGIDWTKEFTVQARADSEVFEGRDNDTFDRATALTVSADSAGTLWHQSTVAAGRGQHPLSPGDWWSFEAIGGDQLALLSSELHATALYFDNGSDEPILLDSRLDQEPVSLEDDGTYLIKLSGNEDRDYRFAVNLYRGEDLEADQGGQGKNDYISDAEPLRITPNPSSAVVEATIGGTLPQFNDRDYFSLGTLTTGTNINFAITDVAVDNAFTDVVLVDAIGSVVSDLDPSLGGVSASIPSDGEYFAKVFTRSITYDSRLLTIAGDQFVDAENAIEQAGLLGGKLPTIDSEELSNFLSSNFLNRNYWLGLTNHDGGTPEWIDGTPYEFDKDAFPNETPLLFYDYTLERWVPSSFANNDSVYLVAESDTPTGAPTDWVNNYRTAYSLHVQISSTDALEIIDVVGLPEPDQVAQEQILHFSILTNIAIAQSNSDTSNSDTSNYELIGAGPDDAFGTADDYQYDVSANFNNDPTQLNLSVIGGPLSVGLHRFTISTDTVGRLGNPLDGNGDGTPGDAFVREFTVNHDLPGLRFDTKDNNTFDKAVEFTFTADTAGTSWSRSERGLGISDASTGDDWWSFDVNSGDYVTVLIAGEKNLVSSTVHKLDSTSGTIQDIASEIGDFQLSRSFQAIDAGTYFLKIPPSSNSNNSGPHDYRLEIQTNSDRPIELFNTGSNYRVVEQLADGQGIAKVAGSSLPPDDFAIGFLMPGTQVDVTIRNPDWVTEATAVGLGRANVLEELIDIGQGEFLYSTVVSERGTYSLEATSTDAFQFDDRIFATQYELDIRILDTVVPQFLTTENIPTNGEMVSFGLDNFRLQFSEPVNESQVDSSVLVVDNAGLDGQFDTADDFTYPYTVTSTLESISFTSPALEYFLDIRIEDSSLMPGKTRIRLTDQVSDRFGNRVDNATIGSDTIQGNGIIFERQFTVEGETSGFINEALGEESYQNAASLPLIDDFSGTAWSQSVPGRGRIGFLNDADWFQFEAVAGDSFEVFVDATNQSSSERVRAYYEGEDGLEEIDNSFANGFSEANVVPKSGQIYLEIMGSRGLNYEVRVNVQSDGIPLITDSRNNSMSRFQDLPWTGDEPLQYLSIAGTIHAQSATQSDIDHYYLGDLNEGAVVQAGLRLADWTENDLSLEIVSLDKTTFESAVVATANMDRFAEFVVTEPNWYFARIQDPNGGDNSNQYRFNAMVADSDDNVPPKANVQATSINGGSSSRSVIDQVQLTLDNIIDVDRSQFELFNLDTGKRYRAIEVQSQKDTGANQTIVDLRFDSSPAFIGASLLSNADELPGVELPGILADGEYQLRFSGGSINPTDDHIDLFFAKYGDSNGDGLVSLTDFAAFRGAFGGDLDEPNFDSRFDADRNGSIGLADFARFRHNFG